MKEVKAFAITWTAVLSSKITSCWMMEQKEVFLQLKLPALLLLSFPALLLSLTAYADRQFATGQYNLAAKEYQRALFFGPSESVGLLTIKTGDCFFDQGNFGEAEKYYTFASNIITDDSLRFEALSKKAVCLIRQQSYQQAILDLYTAETDFAAEAGRQKAFLLGTCFYGLGEFSEANTHFHEALNEPRSVYKDSLTLLLQNKKLMRPDP
ncbi:tetratricopeptide repeat protein, partial [Candidatus Roizmanbacteria bacterium]|nr:tetratricopeptide repeat protein [Candidatus Roizmanbacteria bacterium]